MNWDKSKNRRLISSFAWNDWIASHFSFPFVISHFKLLTQCRTSCALHNALIYLEWGVVTVVSVETITIATHLITSTRVYFVHIFPFRNIYTALLTIVKVLQYCNSVVIYSIFFNAFVFNSWSENNGKGSVDEIQLCSSEENRSFDVSTRPRW